MTLLQIALSEAGFLVKNLGILNTLRDMFEHAAPFDIVMISCMNGHADLFLDDFPHLLKQHALRAGDPSLWYLGGNLSVQDDYDEVVRKYLYMGFHFVAPKPIPCEDIIERARRDLYKRKNGYRRRMIPSTDAFGFSLTDLAAVHDEPMTAFEFDTIRPRVLDSWETGEEVRVANIKQNHAEPAKSLPALLASKAGNHSLPLLQPRTGVAHINDEIDILLYLQENGMEVSSIQLDAASRKKMYEQAKEGVERTQIGNKSFLNGFPVPVHGVTGVKSIVDAIDTPFQLRAGSPDHRLVYEIGAAGGATSLEGGFLCYLFPYDKFTSPVESLRYWKYIDTLVGYYQRTYDITINREYFGPLTCCLIEPTIPIVINIVEAVLSAKAGVKCVSVGLAEQGNRIQDIAAIRTLEKMTRIYLAKYGCGDVAVSTVFHQYMAAFPSSIDKAMDLLFHSAVTGALSGATRMMTKTFVEAHHIPAKEDNGRSLQLIKQGMKDHQRFQVDADALARETEIIERQVTSIMSAIEKMGQGSMARGAMCAFDKGILDIIFSPSKYNKGKLLTARDKHGAIRFVNPEGLPFPKDIIDFHLEAIQQRKTAERENRMFKIIENDLTRVWKNDFLHWPLDTCYIV
jgi:methylaspartate mutase epsilon subunit